MHTTCEVFLDEGDEVKVGGSGQPFMWVRIFGGKGIDASIFSRSPELLDAVGEACLRAANDLRSVQSGLKPFTENATTEPSAA